MHHPPPPIQVRIDDLGVVSTWINGKGPYHFALDTGAGITVITPEFARRAGLTGSGTTQATGSGGTIGVKTLVLHDVRVGKADVSDVDAAIIPLPLDFTYQGDYGTIDGIIGYSFLAHFAVTIALEKHAVTFWPPGTYRTPSGATSVRADLSDNTPVVVAQADGYSGPFKLDTGDDGDLTLTASFVAAHQFAKRYSRGVPMLFEGVGGLEHGMYVRMDRFMLGGITLPNQLTMLSLATRGTLGAGTLAGNVGDDILRRFIFTVDYPNKRVDFAPNADAIAEQPYRRTGLSPMRRSDGTFVVIAVVPGSPGGDAGVHVGDVLTAINGDPLAHLDRVQIQEALQAPRVTYTLRSGGTERNVTLVMRDQLGI
ncbi:MAG: aspartyl protease family protein [Candidatus Aquilonibacter sp.]